MGANPTQAQGFLVFLLSMTLLAGGLATGGNVLLLLGALALLAGAVVLFTKCKPWEHDED